MLTAGVITSEHPDGNGRPVLSPDELLDRRSRLGTATPGYGLTEAPQPEVVQGEHLRRRQGEARDRLCLSRRP